ncbi:MAG: cobalamin biosynthesis protein [Candidatus Nitrosocaldaceae archaeon]
MKIAVIAITKNGKEIAKRIRNNFECEIYMPRKFADDSNIIFYDEPTPLMIGKIFNSYNALICIFSLGAVVRMLAKYLQDKKRDPAVLVIDDKANFVISVLSGHLGGANILARTIAEKLNATPVITTAADVNNTISIDLLGREFGWVIDDDKNVTSISADMVNEEPIAIYQDAGEKGWYDKLPKNVILVNKLEELRSSNAKSYIIISDKVIDESIASKAVIYRPKSLVVGVGLHHNTSKDEIRYGIEQTFNMHGLSLKSIRCISTLDRGTRIKGLEEYANDNNLPIEYYSREELSNISVPNPSEIVAKYENVYSVAEATALLSSKGAIIVEKQKYPPNLTVAVARIRYE